MASVKDFIIFTDDIRAKSKTPLAAVLFAASGYMIELTAEKKTCSGKFFGCVVHDLKGDTQGGKPWERFGHFGAGQSDCRAA